MAKRRCARYVFTINNPTEGDLQAVQALVNSEAVLIATVGQEEGEHGTPHLQGFAVLGAPCTRRQFEAAIGGRGYVAAMVGSVPANKRYCAKGGNVLVEKGGELTGTRTEEKWGQVLAEAKRADPEQFQIRYPDIWLKMRGAIERVMLEAQADAAETWGGELQAKNVWIWGRPGIGKSMWASKQRRPRLTYKKNVNKWWDGFIPLVHTIVICEDWDPGHKCLCGHLKNWADRYPFIGEVKCSSLLMIPGKWNLVVTSNYSIEQCFDAPDDEAIRRRFMEIEMTDENKILVMATVLGEP
jgi:hypothetical protein